MLNDSVPYSITRALVKRSVDVMVLMSEKSLMRVQILGNNVVHEGIEDGSSSIRVSKARISFSWV